MLPIVSVLPCCACMVSTKSYVGRLGQGLDADDPALHYFSGERDDTTPDQSGS